MSARGPRFLIVRLGALGDVIHGIPVAAALRARYPESRIDWLVDPRYVELLAMVRGVDRAVAINPRANGAQTLATIRELRRRRYTAAFDLQGLVKSAVLARLAGAQKTIGFARRNLREPVARFFYTVRVEADDDRHVIHKNLSLLKPTGIETDRIDFPIAVRLTPAARLVNAEFEDAGYVVVNAGAAWPNKQWGVERFGTLAAEIRHHLGLRSLVLWGPGEERAASAVVAASAGAAVIAPPTSISDTVSLMATARLVISGDTGPLHIAAAVGTPVVGLFGPTNPARNGPWSAADLVVSRFEQCSCAYERSCHMPARCIDDISVEAVVAAAGRRLAAAR